MSSRLPTGAGTLYLALPLFAILSAVQPSIVRGQAVVNETRVFHIAVGYEEVLSRLDGEDSTREMFASQDVTLKTYLPRKSDSISVDKEEEGVTRATIDIVGHSCEFGSMSYLMSVVATEKETSIDVELVQPVGMLRRQKYHYRVIPRGERSTSISISHELDILLMKRRLNLVNRIISTVTYEKACEELHCLTGKMVESVLCIANRSKPKKKVADVASSDDDAEMEEAVDEVSNSNFSEDEKRAEDVPDVSVSADKPNTGSKENAIRQAENTSDRQSTLEESLKSETSPSDATSTSMSVAESVDPVVPNPLPSLESTDKSTEAISAQAAVPLIATLDKTKPIEPGVTKVADDSNSVTAKPGVNEEPKFDPSIDKVENMQSPALRIVIDGITVSSGAMRIALFKTNEQFKSFDARKDEGKQGDAFRKVVVRVKKSGKLIYDFKDVPTGAYVIAAFHDQDSNKKLNASLIGLPSEPYGFSRDARGSFGAPSFEDAVIKFDDTSSSFNFRIK